MRVRYHGDLARIELAADVLDAWLTPDARTRIATAIAAAGFERVAIDARGFRSGSLNILGGVVAEPLVRARSVTSGDAVGLSAALGRIQLACDVEARDRLAVLLFEDDAATDKLRSAAVRERVVDVARGHGFTHVGIEIGAAVGDAAVRCS
jgi:hypothetical protein